jgi:hypothetical protein
MVTPVRKREKAETVSTPLREDQVYLSSEELAVAVGIAPPRLARLIRLGVVEPSRPGTSPFSLATAARLRRMLRLHADLGVNFIGAAIIVDLLERLERLEAELSGLRGGRP